jgi:hypothetical protein
MVDRDDNADRASCTDLEPSPGERALGIERVYCLRRRRLTVCVCETADYGVQVGFYVAPRPPAVADPDTCLDRARQNALRMVSQASVRRSGYERLAERNRADPVRQADPVRLSGGITPVGQTEEVR